MMGVGSKGIPSEYERGWRMKRAGSIVFMAGIVCMVSACGNLYSQSNEETEDICLSVLAGQSTPVPGLKI